ncbi:MAG: glycosyltransferase [Akkermansiaceae bacterium]
MKPEISVIFPVGPGANRACFALADILGQSWKSLEVIFLLNGCPSAVREEVCGLQDDRVRVVDLGEEGCLLDALNEGIRLSRGK